MENFTPVNLRGAVSHKNARRPAPEGTALRDFELTVRNLIGARIQEPLEASTLAISEQRFRAFANRLPMMVWQQDADGNLIFANDAWFQTLRLVRDSSSFSPEAWASIVHPDDYPGLLAVIDDAVKTRSAFQFPYRLKPADGDDSTYRWYQAHATPEYFEGVFRGWTGYVADIHDSYDGNAMFRCLFDADIIGIVIAKVTGQVISANNDFLRMTGYTRDDLNSGAVDWRKLTPPEWLGTDSRAFERLRATGAVTQFRKEFYRKDGTRFPVMLGMSRLPGPGDSALFYVLDLTAVEVAEAQLAQKNALIAQSERHFKAMANSIPVIVWTATADGWIDWYNSQWYTYTGLNEDEAEGWGWQSVHHPDYFPKIMKLWPESIATGTPFEMEFPIKRHDGEYRWFLTRVNPLKDESGTVIRWYGSNIDIQVQRESLTRAQQISEVLQQLFFPQSLPTNEQLRFDSVYVPAEKDALVGGDWFEAVQLPNGCFLVSVGDVAGHGLEASSVAGKLRQSVIDFSMISDNPLEILNNVNRVLRFQYPEVYATALVGMINRECTNFIYASAGHPPPIIAYEKHGKSQLLPYGGIPLGVQADLEAVAHACEIRKDAVLALYTDGLTEFSRDIESAEERLMHAVAGLVGDTAITNPATAVKNYVLDDAYSPDDIALLVIQFSDIVNVVASSEKKVLEKVWLFHSSDAYTAHRLRKELMMFIGELAADTGSIYFAELIIGEILSNTVRHAPGLVEIHIDWSDMQPVITVLDTGQGLDHLNNALPSDIMREGGRGHFLIDSLGKDFSVRRRASGGTRLQVTLPIWRHCS